MHQAFSKLRKTFPNRDVSVDLIMESWHAAPYYSAYCSNEDKNEDKPAYTTNACKDYYTEFDAPMKTVDWLIDHIKEEECH
jgi:hypothetical protein